MTDAATPIFTEGFTRRTIVKGAAWTIPVIAVATATPAAAASGDPEPIEASYWYTGATLNIHSGGVVVFNAFTQDYNGDPGLLPAGSTFAFTPRAGVVLDLVSVPAGIVALPDGNGGYLLTIQVSTLTGVQARVRVTGPAGLPALDIHSEVDVDPWTDDITINLRP